ncbi:MAG: methyltransferase domain-containing protein [Chthoniobacterales bacterium]
MNDQLKPSLTDLVQNSVVQERVAEVVAEYRSFHAGEVEGRQANYARMINDYYDLVTDFYEFGWGHSFHFAPRFKGEAFEASLRRHQLHLADVLGLKAGMRVLDVGCGIGGPMRNIARDFGATIIGVNNNDYQIRRGQRHNQAAALGGQCSFLKADFMALPLPDDSLDAVYAIEATCHAPDKRRLFRELFRVMKPGMDFAGYEWCLTPKYEGDNPAHHSIKKGIEAGAALPDIAREDEVVNALRDAGFEIMEARDYAASADRGRPWWLSLSGSFLHNGFKRSPEGRWLTRKLVRLLETVRVAPRGSTAVATFLEAGARALVAGGKSGIFTPMFFFHARKPPT